MYKIVPGLLFVILMSLTAHGQKTAVKGRVIDSAAQKGLAYATVSLVKAKDSTLVTFARADSAGYFKLTGVEGGSYLISSSYVGHVPVWKPVVVTAATSVFDAGVVYMADTSSLTGVYVLAKRPPVEINNDTLEFNTENFKTQPNAVVEDMLKKMPGVTVESDGTVKVNGQTVKRVLVNGREFFTGDIKMATKNLSADAVDKVQVFDKKSDQSTFTGVDDGNTEKTINLKLKKDRNNALFGKVTAGAGNDGRYDAQANINKFKGNEQASFIGMANNTNRQGFSLMDVLNFTGELSRGMRNGGGGIHISTTDGGSNNGLPVTGLGQNQQGVASTAAGGLNYNNLWNKGKTDLSASYTGSNVHLLTNTATSTQYLLPGNDYNRNDSDNTVNNAVQHRLNIALDQKVDSSLSFKITPSLTWQHSNKSQQSGYTSATAGKVPLNEGYSNVNTQSDAFNTATEALVRKRLRKKGRTISADINIAYNHSTQNGAQLSHNTFYDAVGGASDSTLNLLTQRDAVTKSFGGNITYTEPVGKKSLVALSAFYNSNTGQSNRQVYNYNSSTHQHDVYDSLLSNDFSSNYTYSGGSVSYRANRKKISFTAGAALQAATLSTTNNTTGQNIRQAFTDVLPNAMFQYQFSQTKNLRLEYNASTMQPSAAQLQPVADVSDPLFVTTGNAALQRAYSHSITANMFAGNMARRTNIFALLNYTYTANAIVQSDKINASGARVSTPVNTDGVQSLFGNLEYGFPLKKIHSRIEVGSSATYGKNIAFINGEKNNISTTSLGPNITYSFSKDELIDIDVRASVHFNTAGYSLQPALNNQYTRQEYGITTTNYLPWGFSLHNDFNYILNTGRTSGYNTSIPLWNASLAKTFMKNKRGELKLSVYDLLNKNTGITRSSNLGYITDTRYNVLQRYFLLSFTYSLNKSGLKSGGTNIKIKTIEN
jgi:hypothetical protein